MPTRLDRQGRVVATPTSPPPQLLPPPLSLPGPTPVAARPMLDVPGALSTDPAFRREVLTELLPTLGGLVGGLVAPEVGAVGLLSRILPRAAPYLAPLVRTGVGVSGAAAGGGTGMAGANVLTGAPPTAGVLGAAAEEGLMELGGRALVGAGRAALGGQFRRSMSRADVRAYELNRELGLGLTTGEMVSQGVPAGMARGVQAISEATVTGKKAVAEPLQRAGVARAGRRVEDILRPLGPQATPTAVGREIQDAISSGADLWRAEGRRLYGELDQRLAQIGDPAVVDMRPVKDFVLGVLKAKDPQSKKLLLGLSGQPGAADEVLQWLEAGGIPVAGGGFTVPLGTGGPRPFPRTTRPTAKGLNIIKDILEAPEKVSFSAAHDLRSQLLEQISSGELAQDRAAGLARKLAGMAHDAMENAQIPPAVLDAFNDARSFWSRGQKVFVENKEVATIAAKLFRSDPSAVVQTLNTPAKVANVREAVLGYLQHSTNPAQVAAAQSAWDGLQRSFLEQRVLKVGQQGEILPENLLNMKRSLNAIHQGVLDELFPGGQQVVVKMNIEDLADALARMKGASVGIRGFSINDFYDVLRVGVSGTGYAFTGLYTEAASAFLGFALRNRTANRLLVEGIDGIVGQLPAGPIARGAGRAIAQLRSPTAPKVPAALMRAIQLWQAREDLSRALLGERPELALGGPPLPLPEIGEEAVDDQGRRVRFDGRGWRLVQ